MIKIRGKMAFERVANSARVKKGVAWEDWAADLSEYVRQLEATAWPELIVFGGGVSTDAYRFLPEVKARCRLLPARWRNHAGIVGAAAFAAERSVLAMQGQPEAQIPDDTSAIAAPMLALGTGDA